MSRNAEDMLICERAFQRLTWLKQVVWIMEEWGWGQLLEAHSKVWEAIRFLNGRIDKSIMFSGGYSGGD